MELKIKSGTTEIKIKAAAVTISRRDPDPLWMISSWSSIAAVAFLTGNTVVSLVRARDDPPAAAFIVSVYGVLMLLYWCLHAVEKMPENSPTREYYKLPVWALATTLNFLLAFRVSAILPAAMAWLVWGLAGSCCAATFYALLVYEDDASSSARCESKAYSGFEPMPGEEV